MTRLARRALLSDPVNLLLDSHALFWALTAPEKLTTSAAKEIRSAGNQVWFSPVSVWELEIKQAQGKLSLPDGWLGAVGRSRFIELPIRSSHSITAARLPWHHRDPFDRMLVAQAMEEKLRLVTRDRVIALYDIKLLDA